MNMPGFTADVALDRTGRHYHGVAARGDSPGGQSVVSQIRVGGGGVGGIGGQRLGFWCEAGCSLLYAACIALCPGTGPGAGFCIGACSKGYYDCWKDC